MKNTKRLLFFLFVSMLCVSSFAQQDTEFWFAAPYINSNHGNTSPYRLVVFAFDEDATITISMPANPDFTPIVRSIEANSCANIVLANNKTDGDAKITAKFNQINRRGLLVTSTSNVECYYQIDGANSEAFSLKGKNALGTDFFVVGQKLFGNSSRFPTARSSVHIVASEDDTKVEIIPSGELLDNISDTILVLLNKGETYAIASATADAASNIVGTQIKSSAPIAVTVNDDSVTPNGGNHVDDIGEQLLPVDFAGTEFVVVSGANTYDMCIVYALEDNTNISASTGENCVINEGEYKNFSMNGIEVISVQTSRPVMVFQLLSAISGGGELGGTVIPHVQCTGSFVAGYIPFSKSYDVSINLITKKNNISHITINGEQLEASLFKPVDDSDDYYYAKVKKSASGQIPYVVECSTGIFQMGVSEGDSHSSNTYGFFSDYTQQIPVVVEVNHEVVDSVYYVNAAGSLLLSILPEVGFTLQDITWTLPDGTIKKGDQVDLGIVTSSLIGEYFVSAVTEQCGEISRSFKILYSPFITTDALCNGDVYTWEGHYMEDGITPLTFDEPGIYRDTLMDMRGNDSICVLHLEILEVPTMTVRPDTTINLGDAVHLWAIGADYIRWSPDVYLIQNDEMQYIATPPTTMKYTATGYNVPVDGENLVYNGDFEQGNVGFTTDFDYFKPYSKVGSYGEYTIADDVRGFWPAESGKAYGGEGKMMILDGKIQPHSIVWRQMVSIKPHTLYAFSAQVVSALESNQKDSYALLQFAVNDEQVGPIFHSPNELYEWSRYYNLWYSGDDTTAELTIYNQNDSPYGNDFALDEIRFEELDVQCPATATVTISIAGEIYQDTTVCANDVPFDWYGISVDTTGIYNIVIPSSSGLLDSILTLNVTVLPEVPLTNLFDTICLGAQYEWHDSVYTASTIDTLHLMDVHGCDSTVILHLTVLSEVILINLIDTICFGAQYEWQDSVYTASTIDTLHLTDVHGCDSVVILHLTVLPEVALTNVIDTICFGEQYKWQDSLYTASTIDTLRLTDIHGCDSIVILNLTVLPEVPMRLDSVSICEGVQYEWEGKTITTSGDYSVVMQNKDGCDSVLMLHMEVIPTTYYKKDTTILVGDTYMWNGVEYSESIMIVDTLENVYGCDSIVILDLKVVENEVLLHNLDVVEMCADDSVVQMIIEWEGYIDSLGLYFVRDTLDSIEIGLRDTIVAIPADGNLSIPYIYVRAGVHELTVVGYFRQEMMFAENTTLTVLYPSSVMEQRWDDVICVLTSAYNGGYDFTAFQWYKNGSPLAGETGYYLSQALETGAEYSALLTDINGVQLMTCPIIVGYEQPAISVEPTLVAKRQPVRCQVTDAAYVWVYDAMGKLQISSSLQQGENCLHMPQQSGMYMLKVQLLSGEQRAFKVLVQ